MKAKEKALEIYNKMDWFTNGYVGSSMLSNTEFDDQKIKNTKAASMVVMSEIKSALISYGEDSYELQNMDLELRWWDEVENELKLF